MPSQLVILEKWRNDYLNTRTKYSLLVCQFNKDSSCFTDFDLHKWISTALFHPRLVRMYESILIFTVFQNYRNLYRGCLYCDPYNPYHLTFISTMPFLSSNTTLDHSKWMLKRIDDANLYFINIILIGYLPQYSDREKSRRTKNAVLKHITTFSYHTSMGLNHFS